MGTLPRRALPKTGNYVTRRANRAAASRAMVAQKLAELDALKKEMDADQVEIDLLRSRTRENLAEIERMLKRP